MCLLFTTNSAGNNAFIGSIPSEIWLLTGLDVLMLGKLKYLVDHLIALGSPVLPTII